MEHFINRYIRKTTEGENCYNKWNIYIMYWIISIASKVCSLHSLLIVLFVIKSFAIIFFFSKFCLNKKMLFFAFLFFSLSPPPLFNIVFYFSGSQHSLVFFFSFSFLSLFSLSIFLPLYFFHIFLYNSRTFPFSLSPTLTIQYWLETKLINTISRLLWYSKKKSCYQTSLSANGYSRRHEEW